MISKLGLIGFSAGCQRIRSLYRDEGIRAQSGNLWVYSYASQKNDPKAHVEQHEWALPAMAAAHIGPALTGQATWVQETKGSGGGLG